MREPHQLANLSVGAHHRHNVPHQQWEEQSIEEHERALLAKSKGVAEEEGALLGHLVLWAYPVVLSIAVILFGYGILSIASRFGSFADRV